MVKGRVCLQLKAKVLLHPAGGRQGVSRAPAPASLLAAPPSLGTAGVLSVASLLVAGIFHLCLACVWAGLCSRSLLGNGCSCLHFGSGVGILVKGMLAALGVLVSLEL